jgi:CMP-2-keto-3-deoxyoctulosonic acid synthetase
MENGFTVKVAITDVETMCIDTPEDLEKARAILAA